MIAIVSLCTISICLLPLASARAVEDDSISRTSDIVQLKSGQKIEQIHCGENCCPHIAKCCKKEMYCCMEIGFLPTTMVNAIKCD
ncbi:unnamed protein product [Nezara viridula]|uniref:Neuropeptide n=1 Tax=Nezara viridula TaxID=85310 RepID=A0A9P0HSM9_NEZVI|nr:unnamed protein product [Nezara viridula]